eukprot:2253580-Amphidinium_carterae.1
MCHDLSGCARPKCFSTNLELHRESPHSYTSANCQPAIPLQRSNGFRLVGTSAPTEAPRQLQRCRLSCGHWI